MVSTKSIVKAMVLIISGIAIVVVGGFMMGAIARLWAPKETRKSKDDSFDEEEKKT